LPWESATLLATRAFGTIASMTEMTTMVLKDKFICINITPSRAQGRVFAADKNSRM
jgi:hypothetical protein